MTATLATIQIGTHYQVQGDWLCQWNTKDGIFATVLVYGKRFTGKLVKPERA